MGGSHPPHQGPCIWSWEGPAPPPAPWPHVTGEGSKHSSPHYGAGRVRDRRGCASTQQPGQNWGSTGLKNLINTGGRGLWSQGPHLTHPATALPTTARSMPRAGVLPLQLSTGAGPVPGVSLGGAEVCEVGVLESLLRRYPLHRVALQQVLVMRGEAEPPSPHRQAPPSKKPEPLSLPGKPRGAAGWMGRALTCSRSRPVAFSLGTTLTREVVAGYMG